MFSKIYEGLKVFVRDNVIFLITLVVMFAVCSYELDYIVYIPGGNVNLNDRIEVDGGYETSGSFNMAYVSVLSGRIPTILLSYVMPNWDLEKTENITLENQSIDDLNAYNKIQLNSSLSQATIVAYEAALMPVQNLTETYNIAYTSSDFEGTLKVGDAIVSVNGNKLSSVDDLSTYIDDASVGDDIDFIVIRDEEEISAYATVRKEEDVRILGIVLLTTFEFNAEPELSFAAKASESGPSGGLMLTLAIYNNLIEEDLSHGLKIVGTGTINLNGKVGEIDGVRYKILGSKDADIFFCPKENYEEAASVVEEFELDIKVVSVDYFEDALNYLNELN